MTTTEIAFSERERRLLLHAIWRDDCHAEEMSAAAGHVKPHGADHEFDSMMSRQAMFGVVRKLGGDPRLPFYGARTVGE